MLGDLVSSAAALFISLYVWGAADEWLHFSSEFLSQRPSFWYYLMPAIWVLLLIVAELYDQRRSSRRRGTFQGLVLATVASIMLYLLVYFTSSPFSLPRRGVAVFIGTSFLLTLLWRLFYIRVFTAPLFMRRVLIVGAGRSGQTLSKIVHDMYPPPFFIVGLIDDDKNKIDTEVNGFKVLGGSANLLEIAEREQITDLVFAISGKMNPEMFQALLTAEERGIAVSTMQVMYEDLLGRVPIFLLRSDWILRSFVDQVHAGGMYEFGKRLIDLAAGCIGFLLLVILYPFIALIVMLDSGFPVLYKQTRLGLYGKEYKIIKFRTMRKDAEKDGKARMAVQNDDRVTHVGKLLRKSHLDELPQFVNVLRGEMSMVGPRAERPELVDELQREVPFYRARLLVKPGLTGWAQINYGYVSDVEGTAVKLEYDLFYIKHRDLMLDLMIIIRTIGTVIGFRGQ